MFFFDLNVQVDDPNSSSINLCPCRRTLCACVCVTCVPLHRQQVVGDAPHGLQGGVCDLVGREDDVPGVGGAAPGQDGDGVRPPSLQRPVANVDEELHVGQPDLQEQHVGEFESH